MGDEQKSQVAMEGPARRRRLALAAVWVAVVATFLLGTAEGLPVAGDDRLVDPGSAEEPSPVVLEEKRRRQEVAALDHRIKEVRDLGEAFETNPEHAATELKEAAQSIQGELTQDRQRADHISGEASAVENLFRSIANTREARDAAEMARDASIAAEADREEDLGESGDVGTAKMPGATVSHSNHKVVTGNAKAGKPAAKKAARQNAPPKTSTTANVHSLKATKRAHHGQVWSDAKGEYVSKVDMVKAQAEAKKDYAKMEQETNNLDPAHIRRNAMRIAKTEMLSSDEAAALAAEKADEGAINVAKRHDASMELESYEELQTHKLQEVRDKESDILPKLLHATSTIDNMQKELRASLEEKSVLRNHAATMAMKSVAASDVGLGQGMDEDSTAKSKLTSHVAKALADKVDREDWENNRLTAAERARLVASIWKEGHTMLAKEAELNRAKKRYQLKKMAYAVRAKWDKDSLVDAFNVETQKWYKGRILGRHGNRLNVQFTSLGINEWLPDMSKRLRVPKDAVQVDPEMGESASVGSKAADVAGTMSNAQIGLVQKGVSREASDQRHVLKLVKDLARRSETLRNDIKNHIEHPAKHIAVQPTGATEYFIPEAVPKPSEGPTKTMTDLGIDDVGEGASETRFINNKDHFSHPDLGESSNMNDDEPDLGESADLGIRIESARHEDITEQKLAAHDEAAELDYDDHMHRDEDLDAKNRMMKMTMADLEKSALQHEVLMRAKVAKLANEDSPFKHKVVKKLRKMKHEEKAQLKKVNFASRLGVWNNVAASVAKDEAIIRAKTKTVDANLQQEDRFREQVTHRAAELAKEAERARRLERSAVALATRLGDAASPAQ